MFCTKLIYCTGALLSFSVVFQYKNQLLLTLWVCGREARECGQPVGRATTELAVCTDSVARSMGCPHVFSSGRSAVRGLVHISTGFLMFGSSTLAQDTPGRLRRWINLRCVGWLPPDFTASRSWPFSNSRDHRAGTSLRGLSRPTPL